MTLLTAISFEFNNDGDLFEFKGWISYNSATTATNKKVAVTGPGQQDVYFFGFQNENSIQIEIIGDDPLVDHTSTAFYKALKFEDKIMLSKQSGKPNWIMKIYYNNFTTSYVDSNYPNKFDNPSTQTGKISSFSWDGKAPTHNKKITGQVTFSFDSSENEGNE